MAKTCLAGCFGNICLLRRVGFFSCLQNGFAKETSYRFCAVQPLQSYIPQKQSKKGGRFSAVDEYLPLTLVPCFITVYLYEDQKEYEHKSEVHPPRRHYPQLEWGEFASSVYRFSVSAVHGV
jgi:hypothetical protein